MHVVAKRHFLGRSDIKQQKIKATALAAVELCLPEGMFQLVIYSISQSVENSIEYF